MNLLRRLARYLLRRGFRFPCRGLSFETALTMKSKLEPRHISRVDDLVDHRFGLQQHLKMRHMVAHEETA